MKAHVHIIHRIILVIFALMPLTLFAQDVPITTFNAGDIISADDVNANFAALQAAIQHLQQRISGLEQENQVLKQENERLQTRLDQLQASGTLPENTAASQTASAAMIRLRSTPLTASDDEAIKKFKLTSNRKPSAYIGNQFERRGDVVIDHATGLMWQQSGSQHSMTHEKAQEYVQDLNRQKWAGYQDWRLPTIDELLSLLEPAKHSNDLYIDPIFNRHQTGIFSSDRRSSGSVWYINLNIGNLQWCTTVNLYKVRAVRSQ